MASGTYGWVYLITSTVGWHILEVLFTWSELYSVAWWTTFKPVGSLLPSAFLNICRNNSTPVVPPNQFPAHPAGIIWSKFHHYRVEWHIWRCNMTSFRYLGTDLDFFLMTKVVLVINLKIWTPQLPQFCWVFRVQWITLASGRKVSPCLKGFLTNSSSIILAPINKESVQWILGLINLPFFPLNNFLLIEPLSLQTIHPQRNSNILTTALHKHIPYPKYL